MSLVTEILEHLWDTTLYYKGVRVNLFGVPVFWDNKKGNSKKSFCDTFYRLKNKGYIEKGSDKWILTQKGKQYFETKRRLSLKFVSPFVLNAPKNLILMFDIPESRRSERRWLVWHLKEFQYYMIQKSVWVGPSPLPKKFMRYINGLNLNLCIKTFKLSKPYQINKNKLQTNRSANL